MTVQAHPEFARNRTHVLPSEGFSAVVIHHDIKNSKLLRPSAAKL